MSITLTTGNLVAVNGVTKVNDTSAFCTNMMVDYVAGTATFAFKIGTMSGNTFTTDTQYGNTVTLTVNLITGNWASFDTVNGNKAGNISGAALTNFVNEHIAIQNAIETFAAGASGILPGTQVAATVI